MRKPLIVLLVVAAMSVAVMAVSAASAVRPQIHVEVTKAPVAGDGTTAGAVPDLVLTFADLDPGASGIGIEAGGKIEIVLPDEYVNTGAGTNSATVLQGWQASPPVVSFPPPVFPWTTTVTGNSITVDMTHDILPIDSENPGPKQVHLLLNGFINPDPGNYRIGLTITPDGTAPGDTVGGTGAITITPRARPSVNIVSVLSGNPPPPPFKNVQYQTIDQGSDPDTVGLYLWDTDAEPFVGVDIVMANRNHYRFVQDRTTVGHIWIDAPRGAGGYTLTTPDGVSTLTLAFLTGLPTAQLITQFSPDPTTTGSYTLTFMMNHGNRQQQFVDVIAAD